jgi:hypothetical protein
MSYETFCECLCIVGFSKETIQRHTSLTLSSKQPYYEDPGGTICKPLDTNTIYKENLFNEVTHLKFKFS